MDIVALIIGILLLTAAAMAIGSAVFVGASVWGISRGIKAVRRKLKGDSVSASPKELPRNAPRAPSQPAQQPTAPPRRPRYRNYEYLDVDNGATLERIVEVMRPFEGQRIIGYYAVEVTSVLEKAEFRHRQLFSEIDNEFEKTSLSWGKFAAPADEAFDAIVRNAALLANRVQAFDVVEYEEMERFYRSGGYSASAEEDRARLERWKLIDGTKKEMDSLRAANSALLLELEKLLAELGKLSSSESSDKSARIAEEVRTLVEETKYYQ